MKKFWGALGKQIVKYLPILVEAIISAKIEEKKRKIVEEQ